MGDAFPEFLSSGYLQGTSSFEFAGLPSEFSHALTEENTDFHVPTIWDRADGISCYDNHSDLIPDELDNAKTVCEMEGENWPARHDCPEPNIATWGVGGGVSLQNRVKSLQDKMDTMQKQIQTLRTDLNILVQLRDASPRRKYVRRPKADPNAPKRPLSAYANFITDRRRLYDSSNLSFTDFAKQCGLDWQNLPDTEKHQYYRVAATEKQKYRTSFAQYRKTTKFAQHQAYLDNFKAKQV